MKKPFFSIIIPAYHEDKLLAQALISLQQQKTKKSYEIIVVVKPSTDNTYALAKKYANKVIIQRGVGIGDARYLGCKAAQGQIIVITDADIIALPDWLDKIDQIFNADEKIVGLTGPYIFTNNPYLNAVAKYARPIVIATHKMLSGSMFMSGSNMAIRKNMYLKAGGFHRTITGLEDLELGMRLNKLGKIAYASEIYVLTTDRRFRKNIVRHIFSTLIPTYYKRVFLKDNNDTKILWPTIRK